MLHYNPQHVSSSTLLIFRRTNCIITASGIVTLSRSVIPVVHIRTTVDQCFSTAGPRPGTGPWHQLYRATRGLSKLQYATRLN